MTGTVRIAVAIPTYQRPERLASLLAVLPERFAELDEGFTAEVFVIDNDPTGSARDVATTPPSSLRVTYAPEPTPGIAAARQHALDATAGFDLLAFIDDDEVPHPNWLRALVDTWRRTGAAAVAGHVHTAFPPGTDPWVLASGLFARPLRDDGALLPAAGAGNLLVDLTQIHDAGISFDTSLGLSGGEDTLFTRAIVRAGGKVVACPLSVAEDSLEAERATRRFALARARHHGQTQSVIELRLAGGASGRIRSRVRNLIKGAGWAARGTLRRVAGLLTGSLARRAGGARDVQRGIGLVQGALGAAAPNTRGEAVCVAAACVGCGPRCSVSRAESRRCSGRPSGCAPPSRSWSSRSMTAPIPSGRRASSMRSPSAGRRPRSSSCSPARASTRNSSGASSPRGMRWRCTVPTTGG